MSIKMSIKMRVIIIIITSVITTLLYIKYCQAQVIYKETYNPQKDTLFYPYSLHYWLNKIDTIKPILAFKSNLSIFNPDILRTKWSNYGLKLGNKICFKEFFITDPTMIIRLGWRFDGKIIWREVKNATK